VAQRRASVEGVVKGSSGFCCRACGGVDATLLIDLGQQPLANDLVDADRLDRPDPTYPLKVRVCEDCLLVQADAVVDASEIFSDYSYFSSFSDTWLAHARRFAVEAAERLHLGSTSHVIEIASNDGYLLRNFVEAGIPSLGIEPAHNVAAVAIAAGVPTEVRFFGVEVARELASSGRTADLIVANNVLAHVPELNDFLAGIELALKPEGVVSIEVPHVLHLIRECQFDTIYHEHYSYCSLIALERAVERHGLRVFDVETLETHGGSLRIWLTRAGGGRSADDRVGVARLSERAAGLDTLAAYARFEPRVLEIRSSLLGLLEHARQANQRVVAYGAAAKGNTLMNFCGIDTRLVEFVADRSPHKQHRWMPGSRIPIKSPDAIREARPDFVLILPWNLRQEITEALAFIRDWGGRFIVPIPEPVVLP